MTYNRRHIEEFDFSESDYFDSTGGLLLGFECPYTGWYEVEAIAHIHSIGNTESDYDPKVELRLYHEETHVATGVQANFPLDSSAYYWTHIFLMPKFVYCNAGDYLYLYGYTSASGKAYLNENCWAVFEYHENGYDI